MIFRVIGLIGCLVLVGCASNETRVSGEIAPDDVVANAKPVIDKTKTIGVQSQSEAQSLDESNRRDFVSREEPSDFVNVDPSRLDEETGMMVSLNFDRVDIHFALELVARMIDKNIVVGNDVSGSVDIRLKNVPWQTALQAILNSKALAYHVEGGLIRVHERDSLLAEEEFFKQRLEKYRDKKILMDGVTPLDTEIFRVYYADLDDLRGQILDVIGETQASEFGPRVVISIDKRQKALIVKAPVNQMEVISTLISKLDRPIKQVLIEAFIVEAGTGFDKALGAQLGINASNQLGNGEPIQISGVQTGTGGALTLDSAVGTISNQSIEGATSGIGILLGTTNQLKVALTALEADSVSRTVSNPKIFTLDTVTASISQGREQPYESSSGDGSGGTTTEFKEAVLKLDVTPTVVGDGNVILEISLQKDTVGAAQIGSDPPINTMDLSTKLLVPDGAIVVIGGIYEDAESEADSQVPGLGDIPGIGRLFQSNTDSNSRNELLIFISPNVI